MSSHKTDVEAGLNVDRLPDTRELVELLARLVDRAAGFVHQPAGAFHHAVHLVDRTLQAHQRRRGLLHRPPRHAQAFLGIVLDGRIGDEPVELCAQAVEVVAGFTQIIGQLVDQIPVTRVAGQLIDGLPFPEQQPDDPLPAELLAQTGGGIPAATQAELARSRQVMLAAQQ